MFIFGSIDVACEQAPGKRENENSANKPPPRPDRFALRILQFRARRLASFGNFFSTLPGACLQASLDANVRYGISDLFCTLDESEFSLYCQ